MSHNGPASMRNRRWWPRTRFLSTPCLSSTHTLFVHPFFFLSNKTYARGFFHFSFSFNSRIFLFVLLLFSCCFFFFSAGLLRRYKHTRMHTLCEMVMGPCHLISSDYFYTRSRARSWISIYWAWLQNSTVITCMGEGGRDNLQWDSTVIVAVCRAGWIKKDKIGGRKWRLQKVFSNPFLLLLFLLLFAGKEVVFSITCIRPLPPEFVENFLRSSIIFEQRRFSRFLIIGSSLNICSLSDLDFQNLYRKKRLKRL